MTNPSDTKTTGNFRGSRTKGKWTATSPMMAIIGGRLTAQVPA